MGGIERRRSRPDQLTAEVSDHLCECGCGQRTMVAPRSYLDRGIVKGEPRRFVFGHHLGLARAARAPRERKFRLRVVKVRPKRSGPRLRPERYVRERSDHPCECGCGEFTFISPVSDASKGWVKGEPRRFVRGHGVLKRWGPNGVKTVRWVAEDRGFETPCWIWQLGVDVHGIGKTSLGGVRLKAHRVAYEEARGPIPAGHDLHHRCEQKTCVNPDHLEPLTPDDHGQLHGEVWRRAA